MLKSLRDPLRPTLDWPSRLKLRCDFGHATVVRLSNHRGYVALGMEDGSLAVLDIETLSVLFRYRAHAGAVIGIQWSDDASHLISVGEDWCACMWDTIAKKVMYTRQFPFLPKRVSFNHEKFGSVAIATGTKLAVYNVFDSDETYEDPEELESASPNEEFTSVGFMKNGALAAGTSKGQLAIYKDPKKLIKILSAGSGLMRDIVYNIAGEVLAVSCGDRSVRVIYVGATDSLEELEFGHRFSDWGLNTQWITVEFSEDGEYLYAAADNAEGTVCVWNTQTQTIVRQLDGSSGRIMSLQFDQFRVTLYGTATSGYMYVWRADRPDTWGTLIPDFELIPDVEVFREDENSWDLPKEQNEETTPMEGELDLWELSEPPKEVYIPVDI